MKDYATFSCRRVTRHAAAAIMPLFTPFKIWRMFFQFRFHPSSFVVICFSYEF